MEQVPMNDGLEGRETIAFGLGAAEVATFVLALLTAYAVLRSGLPGAIGWPMALLVAGGGALLAWGRLAGRPLLEWAVLLAAFTVRTWPARTAPTRRRLRRWTAPLRAPFASLRARVVAPIAAAAPGQAGAVLIPLALRRPTAPATQPAVAPVRPTRGGHVVGFFSLAGGSGRTTLAVEVAAMLAVRARAAAPGQAGGRRVLLLDLAARNPAVGLRLGLAPPPGARQVLATHATGLFVAVAPAAVSPPREPLGFPAELSAVTGADLTIVDFDCDLGEGCHDILSRCDQILVTTTPTVGGVVDAYRSTAVLRRLGRHERISHVVNRWRPEADLGEVMADLGGEVVAEIPEDPGFVAAEDRHQLAGLAHDGELGAALERLALHIERRAGIAAAVAELPWGRHAG